MFIRCLVITIYLFYLISDYSSLAESISSSLLEDDVQYVFKWPGHLLNLENVN